MKWVAYRCPRSMVSLQHSQTCSFLARRLRRSQTTQGSPSQVSMLIPWSYTTEQSWVRFRHALDTTHCECMEIGFGATPNPTLALTTAVDVCGLNQAPIEGRAPFLHGPVCSGHGRG